MQALHTAATGMAAQELSVQVISNNIANLQTTGYKKQTAEFQDLIYEHVRRVGAQASDQGTILPVGIDIGGGGTDSRTAPFNIPGTAPSRWTIPGGSSPPRAIPCNPPSRCRRTPRGSPSTPRVR